MGSGIGVFIPMRRTDLATLLLVSMAKNTVKPDSILIFDNSESDIEFNPDVGIPFKVIKQKINLGVNESWNTGPALVQCDYISILNDDLILGKYFFERIGLVMKKIKKCGVCCPETVGNTDMIDLPADGQIGIMTKREGWAMTMRKALWEVIPRIPSERFSTFCGDDWYWRWTHKEGFKWYKMTGTRIYHKVGGSMTSDYRQLLNRDKHAYYKAVRSVQWNG